MPLAQDVRGTVYKNGSAVLMARVVGPDGSNVMTTDLDEVRYSVFEVDHCRPDALTVVTGHDNVELTVSDVIYDTLQTGGLWTLGGTGYNFRHEIDVSQDAAFPSAGSDYQIRFELTPTSGQVVVFRFLLHAI